MSKQRQSAIPKIRTFADDVAAAQSRSAPAPTTDQAVTKPSAPTTAETPPTPDPTQKKYQKPTPPIPKNSAPTATPDSTTHHVKNATTAEPDDTFVNIAVPNTVTEDQPSDIETAVEAGEIVREKKRSRFRLLPALKQSLTGWAKQQKEDLTREPERETVEDPNQRAATVAAATSASALPNTDDFTAVAAHVAETPRVEATDTLRVTKAEELETPQWTSRLGTPATEPAKVVPTPTTPKGPPAATAQKKPEPAAAKTVDQEPAADTTDTTTPPATPDTTARVEPDTRTNPAGPESKPDPTTAREETAPATAPTEAADAPSSDTPEKVPTPPTPTAPPTEEPEEAAPLNDPVPASAAVNPQPAPTPTAPTPETLPTAPQQTATEEPATAADAPLPAAQATATTTQSPYQFRATPVETTGRDWRTWVVAGVVAIAAIALGVSVSMYVFEYLQEPDNILATEVPSSITADRTVAVALQQGGAVLLSNLAQAAATAGLGVTQVYPVVAADSNTTRAATAEETLSLLSLRADGAFTRNIDEITFIGYDQQSVGIVLRFTSFETALSGMYRWESQLVADLGNFIGASQAARFVDTTSSNRDIRVAKRTDGSELIYTFIDRNTLLITTDRALIAEVVGRLQ